MKAILEFDLPEDDDDLTLALKGKELWFILWEFDAQLREVIKYDTQKLEEEKEIYADIRKNLCQLMDERNVQWDMVR